jgi:hypothetical protein
MTFTVEGVPGSGIVGAAGTETTTTTYYKTSSTVGVVVWWVVDEWRRAPVDLIPSFAIDKNMRAGAVVD